jgi:hypothetical protein
MNPDERCAGEKRARPFWQKRRVPDRFQQLGVDGRPRAEIKAEAILDIRERAKKVDTGGNLAGCESRTYFQLRFPVIGIVVRPSFKIAEGHMTEDQADHIIELLEFIAGRLNALTDDQERLEGLLEGSQTALREMSNKLDERASSS